MSITPAQIETIKGAVSSSENGIASGLPPLTAEAMAQNSIVQVVASTSSASPGPKSLAIFCPDKVPVTKYDSKTGGQDMLLIYNLTDSPFSAKIDIDATNLAPSDIFFFFCVDPATKSVVKSLSFVGALNPNLSSSDNFELAPGHVLVSMGQIPGGDVKLTIEPLSVKIVATAATCATPSMLPSIILVVVGVLIAVGVCFLLNQNRSKLNFRRRR